MPDTIFDLERRYHSAEEGIPKLSAGIAWLMQLVSRDAARAAAKARDIREAASELGYRQGVADAHLIIGRSYDTATDFEAARREYTTALEIYDEIHYPSGYGRALYFTAESYDRQSDYDRATAMYVDALKFLERQKDDSCHHTLCLVLNGLGIIYCRLADYTDGLACFYRAISHEEHYPNLRLRTQLYANISTALMHVGDVSGALENFNTALVLAESNNNERVIAIIRTNIGSIYFHFRDYSSAMAHYLQALDYYTEPEKMLDEGLVALNSNLGSTFDSLGNYSVALGYYSKALAYARQLKSKWSMMLPYYGIGCIYLMLNDPQKAEEYLLQGLALNRELDARREEADTLIMLSQCRVVNNLYDEAVELLHQALALARLLESDVTTSFALEKLINLPEGILPKTTLGQYKRQFHHIMRSILANQREESVKQDLLKLEVQYSLRQIKAFELPKSEFDDMSSTFLKSNRQRVDSISQSLAQNEQSNAKAPDTISVFTLGGFRLVINGREIDRNDWKNRKKARDIFKYLLLNHRKSVPFDTLIDVLWEDAGARDLLPSLWNAASVIRKILQPELPAQTQSQYLLVQDNCYTLNLGEICFIDFVEFQSLIASADSVDEHERKIPYFEKAIALYQGDFLKEDQLAEWTTFEREKMKEQYLQALMFVAEDCAERKQRSKATEYIRLALEADRVYEEAYTLLFTLYSPDKDKIEAQKWAKFCIDSYQKEYGAEPPAALKKLMGIV
ncbi:MAG: tetratricopeptide repeat protein [Candidatus Kapaibacterium sp.]